MKIKILLALAVSMSLFSCNTSKITSKTTATQTVKRDSAVTTIDTTKIQSITIDTDKKVYGDTLMGSLSFTDEQINKMDSSHVWIISEDSIESSGIKVNVQLVPFKGGYKTKIKAISKPTESVKSHTEINTEQKGVATSNKATSVSTSDQAGTVTETKGFPWKLVIILGSILFLIIIVIILKKFV